MNTDSAERSDGRLGSLSRSQLQSALDNFDLGNLVGVEQATEGLFGQNLILDIDRAGGREQWIFRGAPHWPYQFSKERYFVEIVHRMTRAPVPWPYHVERDEGLFGWSYAVMPRLDGSPPSHIASELKRGDWHGVASSIGVGLAEMHGASVAASGEYDPEGDGITCETSFEVWWMRSLEGYRARCLEIPDALDKDDVAYIDELFADHCKALAVPFQPSVVHHDFKEGNIHVRRTAGGWELSGIFDWMTAASGDAEQDLSRMTADLSRYGEDVARSFLEAYRQARPLRGGARDRFRLYMLLDRLWIWEYARRNKVWFDEKVRFRDYARASVDLSGLL